MASRDAKKYEQEEYERYVSSGQEKDNIEFYDKDLGEQEKTKNVIYKNI